MLFEGMRKSLQTRHGRGWELAAPPLVGGLVALALCFARLLSPIHVALIVLVLALISTLSIATRRLPVGVQVATFLVATLSCLIAVGAVAGMVAGFAIICGLASGAFVRGSLSSDR